MRKTTFVTQSCLHCLPRLQDISSPPCFLRDSRASETRGHVKITPREKRRHAAGREKWGTTDKAQAFELMRCSHNTKLWLALPWKSVSICQKRASRYQHSTYHNLQNKNNNSTEQITRVALVKATKQKANLATDEVRVENRNHGLAWSQMGNNRTVARLALLS